MNLCDIETIRAVLGRHGFHFSKSLGQNFLTDITVPERIAEMSGAREAGNVVEVGPGMGCLTAELCRRAEHVVSVELDRALLPVLAETMAEFDNFEVVQGDVLALDLAALCREKFGDAKAVACANLPYYITTPIIMGLFESGAPIDNITVMVQKEVADRMQVGPGSKDYGALSLAVQYYAEPYIVANVPPNCFIPRPNVGSAVIRLTRHAKPPVEVKDKDLMFRLIRASFNQRRKTLQNGLSNAQDLSFSKEEIAAAIESLGLSPSVRGETLTLAQFAALSDVLGK